MRNPTTLDEFIPNKAELARKLGLAPNTVYKWVARNAMPPKRVMEAAVVLNIKPERLLPFAQQVSADSKTKPKRFRDLDVLLAAYQGEPWTPTSTLSAHAVHVTLGHWKDRLPLMVETLKTIRAGGVTRMEAAERLGVAYSTVKQLAKRYDATPPKVEKTPTRVQRNRELAPGAVSDVISGRKTAVEASEHYAMNLRTLHRKVKADLGDIGLNELSHWSRNFRSALAWEVANEAPRIVEGWHAAHPGLPKRPKWPKLGENLREVETPLLLISILIGELEVADVVRRRGGSTAVWEQLMHTNLEKFGIYEMPSTYHQAAAAEILLSSLEKQQENRRNRRNQRENRSI